ncbi:MFS transporter [Nakamurella lactea]|uniref:MFS transporter n=1 Tax=Nakamurella lactea TaxID=459515 RepID=UPI00040704A2|nr:MFS transporter [Nakamurella lactea]
MAHNGVLTYPAFVRFWIADAVSNLGTFVSGLALQLLLIQTMHANQTELGLIRTAQWLPYLLFGLLAGVLVDRVRRRPVLIVTDVCCALLFCAVGVLALAGVLTVPALAVLVFLAGVASMFFRAAHQSLLPSLVPLPLLPAATSRLEQTWNAAQSVGPLVAGALVRFLSAPIAVLADAATYAVSAAVLGTVRVAEPVPERAPDRHLWRELKEGAGWVYRHRTLAPYAISLHLWFFFNSLVTTVLVFFAAVDLQLDALTIGLVLACAGVTGVLGAGLAPRLGDRFGLGRVYTAAEWLSPVAYLVVLFARPGWAGIAALVCSQLLFGLSLGLKGPLEGSYRNAVTPDRLRGRMNATIRSLNWGSIAVSAPLGGLIAATWGNRPAIAVGIVGLSVAALVVNVSPFRSARMPEEVAGS